MRNLYYQIWVDGLLKLKSRPENQGMWKFYGIVFMTMAMAMNLALVMAILQRNTVGERFYDLDINITSDYKLNLFINFILVYVSPPLLINYLLIFRNNRYEKLFKECKSYDGKLSVIYLMTSYFLPFVILFIAFLVVGDY